MDVAALTVIAACCAAPVVGVLYAALRRKRDEDPTRRREKVEDGEGLIVRWPALKSGGKGDKKTGIGG